MSEELFKEYGPREHEIMLDNQSIIELAYLAKEMVEACLKSRVQMSQERARCYQHCFYNARDMLIEVDPEYLNLHPTLRDFYAENRDLSSYDDYLSWVLPYRVEGLGEGGELTSGADEKFRLHLSNEIEQAKEQLEAIAIQIGGESVDSELPKLQHKFYEVGKVVEGLHSQVSRQNSHQMVEKIVAALKGNDIDEFEFTVKGSSFRWSTQYGLEQVQVDSAEDPFSSTDEE